MIDERGSAPMKTFLSYDDIEDILGRDVVRRLDRGIEEAKAAASAAYLDGGAAALEMLVLLHLVSILTSFPLSLDPMDRAERVGTLLKFFVMDVLTARTEVQPIAGLPPAPLRILS